MRNLSSDLTPEKLNQLAGLVDKNNNLLKKARETHALENYIEEVIDNSSTVNRLGVELFKSFSDLRNDFNNSVINLVRYREGLSLFKDFLIVVLPNQMCPLPFLLNKSFHQMIY